MHFTYEIFRKNRRKNLSIVISRDNRIVVRANQSLSETEIAKFVESKKSWISKTLEINEAHLRSYLPKKFTYGEKFLYQGQELVLRIYKGEAKKTSFVQGDILIGLPDHIKNVEKYIKNKLVKWYKEQAEVILNARVNLYSSMLGVTAKDIKIRTLKRTWANCSFKGVLTFSWRLIMAPESIMDYVVVHELAHRIHHNHSGLFWREVERIVPEYKSCKKWLRSSEIKFRW